MLIQHIISMGHTQATRATFFAILTSTCNMKPENPLDGSEEVLQLFTDPWSKSASLLGQVGKLQAPKSPPLRNLFSWVFSKKTGSEVPGPALEGVEGVSLYHVLISRLSVLGVTDPEAQG